MPNTGQEDMRNNVPLPVQAMTYTKLLKLMLGEFNLQEIWCYHYNHNCSNVSLQPTVDEVLNNIFSQPSISCVGFSNSKQEEL